MNGRKKQERASFVAWLCTAVTGAAILVASSGCVSWSKTESVLSAMRSDLQAFSTKLDKTRADLAAQPDDRSAAVLKIVEKIDDGLDEKVIPALVDVESRMMTANTGVERAVAVGTGVASTVASALPSPYRELGILLISVVGTVIGKRKLEKVGEQKEERIAEKVMAKAKVT